MPVIMAGLLVGEALRVGVCVCVRIPEAKGTVDSAGGQRAFLDCAA